MPIVAAFAAFAALLTAGPAAALSPPPAEKAGIVFSNGGRIVSIKADGSGRKVLTRNKALDGGPFKARSVARARPMVGDLRPLMSPGGTEILFNRVKDFDLGDGLAGSGVATMISGAAGEKPRRVLRGSRDVTFSDANWMPDGTHLIATRFVRKRNVTNRAIVVVTPDGTVKQTVLRFRPYVEEIGPKGLPPQMIPTELAVSPDGSRLLATVRDGWLTSGVGNLEVISIATGKRKVIARKARMGSWSPDGERIVYVTNKDGNGKGCWDTPDSSCRAAGELYVVGADGSGRARVTRTRADETSPSWSPDGQRIAFASTRVRPGKSYSNEIYSITPEGTCLTWLTNGSPASEWPSWTGSASDSSDPGACGAIERPPLVEGRPGYPKIAMAKPRLWLGPEFEGRLYSGYFDLGFVAVADYQDCGLYRGSDCPEPLEVVSVPACFMADEYAGVLAVAKRYRVTRERGATVVTGREKGRMAHLVLSGGVMFALSPGIEILGGGGTVVPAVTQNRALKALRLAGRTRPGGKLPPMRIPRPSLRMMRKAKRAVSRAGSIRKAAVRLKTKPAKVREQVQGLRIARKLGPIRPLKCNPRLVDDPWALGARASGGQPAGIAADRIPQSSSRGIRSHLPF